MTQQAIFVPMGAMAALTFLVLLLIPFRRIHAVRRREVTPRDFSLGESAAVPPVVALANRNYMNLLELPALFYPVCLLFFVTARVTPVVLTTAWIFVALRAIHSLIHIGYNNVLHRLTAFALSNVALVTLWVLFFVNN